PILRYRDLPHLPRSRRETEAEVGNVKIAVRSKGHAGGQEQTVSNFCYLVLPVDAYDLACARRGGWVSGRVLKYVKPAFAVEGQSQHGGEINRHGDEGSRGCDLHDLRRAVLDGERVQVADKEVFSVLRDGSGNNVSLGE